MEIEKDKNTEEEEVEGQILLIKEEIINKMMIKMINLDIKMNLEEIVVEETLIEEIGQEEVKIEIKREDLLSDDEITFIIILSRFFIINLYHQLL
jgi:hypothetical protein